MFLSPTVEEEKETQKAYCAACFNAKFWVYCTVLYIYSEALLAKDEASYYHIIRKCTSL